MSVSWPSVQAPIENNLFYNLVISGVVTALAGRAVVELTNKSVTYQYLFWGTLGIVFIVAFKIFRSIAKHNFESLTTLQKSNFQANDTDKYKARIFGALCGCITALCVTTWPLNRFHYIIFNVLVVSDAMLFGEACMDNAKAVRESV